MLPLGDLGRRQLTSAAPTLVRVPRRRRPAGVGVVVAAHAQKGLPGELHLPLLSIVRRSGAHSYLVHDGGLSKRVATERSLFGPDGDLGRAAVDNVRRGRGEGSAEAGGDQHQTQAALLLAALARSIAVDIVERSKPLGPRVPARRRRGRGGEGEPLGQHGGGREGEGEGEDGRELDVSLLGAGWAGHDGSRSGRDPHAPPGESEPQDSTVKTFVCDLQGPAWASDVVESVVNTGKSGAEGRERSVW